MSSPAENLLALIFQAGGSIKHESGMLLVSPKSLALEFSEQIRTHKPEMVKLFREMELGEIKLGVCPVCKEKLDLQGRRPKAWWYCAGCRKPWNEGDYE